MKKLLIASIFCLSLQLSVNAMEKDANDCIAIQIYPQENYSSDDSNLSDCTFYDGDDSPYQYKDHIQHRNVTTNC